MQKPGSLAYPTMPVKLQHSCQLPWQNYLYTNVYINNALA